MKNLRWNIEGKKALVTGATKGIGRAIARELLDFGAEVLINARNEKEIDETVREWQSENLKVHGVAADVAEQQGREKIISAIREDLGGLDFLINNVGTNIRKATVEYGLEDYQKITDTNLLSAFEMSRLAYPFLLKTDSASIVNIVSVAGMTSVGTGTIYGMTKAALIHLTKSLAVEWGKDKIRVNAVAPWFTETPLTESLLAQEAIKTRVIEHTPIGYIAQPEDVSGIVVFLCLPAANYITGQCIATDGGFLSKGF